MFLILSGEGVADIGIENDKVGPMTKLVDSWIARRIGYSLIDTNSYTIIPKQQLRGCLEIRTRSISLYQHW